MNNYYSESKQLANVVLQLDDIVYIAGIQYFVDGFSLSLVSGHGSVDKVFKTLEIEDKKAYCAKYYGYDPIWHYGFPRPKYGDYGSLTRVVIALMKRYEHPSLRLRLTKIIKKHFS